MAKRIFGLVGEFAAGKGTVAKYLIEKHGSVSPRFSDSLREVLTLHDLETSRANMQKISTVLRENFGEDVLAKAITKRVRELPNELIVVDGVRRLTDIVNLRQVPGFYLIAIQTDRSIRHARYIARNENPGDERMSYAEFEKKHAAEADRQVPEVMATADITISNNGRFDELHAQIEQLLKKTDAA